MPARPEESTTHSRQRFYTIYEVLTREDDGTGAALYVNVALSPSTTAAYPKALTMAPKKGAYTGQRSDIS